MLVPSDCGKKSCSVPHFSGEGDEIKEDAHQNIPYNALHCSAFGLWGAWGQTLCVLSPVEVWPVFLMYFNALRAEMASCFSRVRVPNPP